MDAGQLEEGERVLLETMQTHEKILGNKHPDTLVDVFNVIALKRNRGKLRRQPTWPKSTAGILKKSLGPLIIATFACYSC